MSGKILKAGQIHPGHKPEPIRAGALDKVRMGFVGVGLQGSAHVRNFLKIDKVEIKAVCDIVPEKVERIQAWVRDAGQSTPTGYTKGEYDFLHLCERGDLDLVVTATPWKWHVPVCVAAMKNGKHAATEVPAAVTLDACWELVETSEKTQKHCVMLENCCYSRRALLILNLVRKGKLGEVINGTCGYLHDLREVKFNGKDEALWRTAHSITRNGNLYPTHGLGPVAEAMDINRGDGFDYLVSMSSVSRGLRLYAAEKFGVTDPAAARRYALGDVNISLIRTKKGRTITVFHDCSSPRPYSRIDRIQGTRGIIEGYPDRVHIEGSSPQHEWEEFEAYEKEFGHPLWQNLEKLAKGAGHGGMDFLEDFRLIDALLHGRYPDMDVYDAAAWSVVSELSERSVANKSRPMDFPDFTRGAWKTNPRIFIADM
ncbi:MAG: Gfo/Idh/MocA family oxidoreductase [Candidatus Aminicenantes bacterium]|nr:Gfo/Idh/MocA family oxidoreductase [Candidatus Aminicenantes bacterium]